MFPSYRIAIAPFQFSYRIGLQFLLERIFFGMIFITKWGWNAPILKVIRGVSDSYRSDPKPNGNTSGMIIGYDFEMKTKNLQVLLKYLVMFDKEMEVFFIKRSN